MPLMKMATGYHIHSKAQMRAMFAHNPRKAKELADKEKSHLSRLPEKKHPETTIPPSEYGKNMLKTSSLTDLYMHRMLLEKLSEENRSKLKRTPSQGELVSSINPIVGSMLTANKAERRDRPEVFAKSLGATLAGSAPGLFLVKGGVKDLEAHTKASVKHDVSSELRSKLKKTKPKIFRKLLLWATGMKHAPRRKNLPTGVNKLVGGALLASTGGFIGHQLAGSHLREKGTIE